MMNRKYRIDQPDFKAEAWQKTRHDGRTAWICTCYELADGRWEGFVSIVFKQPGSER